MAVTGEPDNTPLPGTVFSPRQVRLLKIAVIVMGILLVGGFALVIATMVYQASQSAHESAAKASIPAGVAADLAIPPGATVTSLALDGDRLALHLQSSMGAEIAVIDLNTGQVLTRFKLKSR